MSIAALQQVYDEVKRLCIAGSDLAANDFRLKKLKAPLERSAAKAPVFGKVASAIDTVLSSTPDNSAQALLQLSSLVSAVLYTQGKTGAEGPLKALPPSALKLAASPTSARLLKPLLEALTTTGSGRLELIRDAHARGDFHDLRLIRPALDALEDPYPEIADFMMTQVLPIYGAAIVPELRERFDMKGKGPAARRLRLMATLSEQDSHPLVLEALQAGSKEVKLAAVACLQGRADAVPVLLPMSKSRNKEVRAAAFAALGPVDAPEVIELLRAAICGPAVDIAAPHVGTNPSHELRDFIHEQVRLQMQVVLQASVKVEGRAKRAPVSLALERLHALLGGVLQRRDEQTQALLLDCLAQQQALAPLASSDFDSGERAVQRIAQALLQFESSAALKALADLSEDGPPCLVPWAFIAHTVLKGPEQAYAAFAPAYLQSQARGRTKAVQRLRARGHALKQILPEVVQAAQHASQGLHSPHALFECYRTLQLDPRWLDAALQIKDHSLVVALARPAHPGLQAYLEEHVQSALQAKRWEASHPLGSALGALILTEHPKTVPLFVEAARRSLKGTGRWSDYMVHINVFAHIPDLPAEAIAPLKALIATADEKLLDGFVGPLDVLTNKHAR